jgi:hypothetical protein
VAKPGDQWRPAGARSERERRAEPVGLADGRRPGLEDLVLLTQLEGGELWLSLGGPGSRVDREWRQGAFAVASPDWFSADNAETSCLRDERRPFGRPGAGNVAAAGQHAVKCAAT